MYFTNINDSELSQFHQTVKDNFIMILTDALVSDLFKVETIISDSIYKLYPLFYCESIESSNPIDKVMDNRCIICKKDNNTVLSFKTDIKTTEIQLAYQVSYAKQGIIVYCNDKNTGNPISDVNIDGIAYQNSPRKRESFTGVTDENGFYYQSFSINGNSLISLTLEYDGVTYDAIGE